MITIHLFLEKTIIFTKFTTLHFWPIKNTLGIIILRNQNFVEIGAR
jgi:hypothetical protein